MNPPNDPRTKHPSLPYTPDADTSPQSSTPDRTEPEADGTGIRFGPPAAAGEIGTLGRFRIKKELGRGGMGAVFLALDTRLERQIALKVMLPQAAANQTAKDRFIREARAAARISHDNVIAILDADELDGVPFIALPYLQGYPLDQFLKKKGNPSIAQAMRMGREMALGLAAAHDLGIVHRDIKPGNIWLEAPNGRVKILDFGLAKPQDDESGKELTHSGAVMGTPAYMAPEQAAGLKVDHRADLYSLGTVLYRLVTGRTPFERPGGMMALLTALAIEPPPPVHDFNPDVPPALAELIHQLLHKDREQRPQSAKDVAKRLAAVRENPAVPDVSLAPQPAPAYVPVPVTLGSQSNAFADIDADGATQREPRRKDPTAVLPVAKPNRTPLYAMVGVGFFVMAVGGYFLSKMLKGPLKVPEVVEKKSPAEEPKKDPTPRAVPPSPPTAAPILYDAWVPVTEFASVKAAPRGPLDELDPMKIPAAQRLDWPKELVAIVEGAGTAERFPAIGAGAIFSPLAEGKYFQVLDGAFRPAPAANRGLRSPGASYRPVLVSPDGQSVVGLAEGGLLVGYTRAGGGLLDLGPPDEALNGPVVRLAWGPDGRTIYFVNNKSHLYRWRPFETDATGEKLLEFGYDIPSNGFPHGMAVSPSGQLLAVATPRGVELLDLANEPSRPKENWLGIAVPKARRTLVPDSDTAATTLAFSPGNRFLYFNGTEKTIRRVDLSHPLLASNDVVAEMPLAPHRFEFTSDGKILVAANGKTLKWWDATVEPFKLLGSHTCSNGGTHWQLAPDGRHLMIVDSGDAYVLRLATSAVMPVPIPTMPAPDPVSPVPPKAAVPAKWLDLTLGKRLADWDQFVTKGWSLKNGILEADGSAQGWVGTKKDYTDFELELEYRLPPKGNSGIFLRAWENNQPMGSEFVEIQLLDDAGYPATMTGASQRNGSIIRQVAPNPAPRFKVNQWNTVKLTVVGKHVTATFNDTKCIDADVTFARMTGRVGLQHYRTPAEFRNVRIREK